MKKVIACEGPNDTKLLKQIHENRGLNGEFDIFHNHLEEDISETQRLRFYRARNNFNYLYKSEGGISKIAKVLADDLMTAMEMDEIELSILAVVQNGSHNVMFGLAGSFSRWWLASATTNRRQSTTKTCALTLTRSRTLGVPRPRSLQTPIAVST